jgi:hypothetical protein
VAVRRGTRVGPTKPMGNGPGGDLKLAGWAWGEKAMPSSNSALEVII